MRQAGPEDGELLLHAVAIAADWRPGVTPRSVADVLASPELAHYAPHLSRPGDRGLVAEDEAAGFVGAAWWRCFLPEDRGYGFVAADVPEVSLGVLQQHRGQGIGTRLMRDLITLAAENSLRGLSLSVEPENFAAGLYRKLGFVQVGVNGGAVTLLLTLDNAR